MNKKAIGVFDSGLGGLTVVKSLKKLLPREDIVYFGDTGRLPYGSRSRETIIKYAEQDIDFMLRHNVKLIVAACGTVSSVALDEISPGPDIPIVGVVKPSAAAAVAESKNQRIAVLGTQATISSEAYPKAIKNLNPDAQVFTKSCPLFVPLVENGYTSPDNQVTRLIADEYLSRFSQAGVDTIILGCTHYPMLSEAIARVVGSGIKLIDSGLVTAEYVKKILTENQSLNNSSVGRTEYYVSDRVEGFSALAAMFLGENIDDKVKRVYID